MEPRIPDMFAAATAFNAAGETEMRAPLAVLEPVELFAGFPRMDVHPGSSRTLRFRRCFCSEFHLRLPFVLRRYPVVCRLVRAHTMGARNEALHASRTSLAVLLDVYRFGRDLFVLQKHEALGKNRTVRRVLADLSLERA